MLLSNTFVSGIIRNGLMISLQLVSYTRAHFLNTKTRAAVAR